jgi:hypothetical protein
LLGFVDNKLIIGRDVFLPISAEIHYFRVPKRYWSICFERIKKSGFRIISSLVPWNLHEEKPGQFDFQGLDNPYKDLIVFLELAREFGFKIILRPGPWIRSEWPDGGLPRYIFADESLIARDHTGALLMAKNSGGVRSSYQPSYLHPKYLNHVKRYVGGLVDSIQNYIFPKGPVFLIQLDSEIDFGGNDELFEADYNSYVVSELYPAFLEQKYETTKNLPSCYGRAKTFASLSPPVELDLKRPENLIRYFDWLQFKGKIIEDYIKALKERWEALGVGCMFAVSLPSSKSFNIPVSWENVREERLLLGASLNFDDDLSQISTKLRLLRSLAGYTWSSQLAIGMPANSDGAPPKIDHRRQRFMLILALAAGLKGLNYYMFVGRNHWTGSPLEEDGTVNQSYEDIRKLNMALEVMDLGSALPRQNVAIGRYRPYDWYGQITDAGDFAYINDLVKQTFTYLASDLANLNLDYEVCDIDRQSNIQGKGLPAGIKILFVPCGEFMSAEMQKKLAELVAGGLTVVFVGLMPKYDLLFRQSKALSRQLGIQTKPSYGSAQIKADNQEFKSIVYGNIQARGSARTIARAAARPVGVSKKLGKGKFYFFTYDISARSEPGKLGFLKQILEENNIKSHVNCSDPGIEVVVHTNDKGAVLYLVNTNMNQPSGNGTRKVVVSVDLGQLGFRQAKTVLHDIFDPEAKIQTTSQALKEGLIFEIGHLDARIYWIPKK